MKTRRFWASPDLCPRFLWKIRPIRRLTCQKSLFFSQTVIDNPSPGIYSSHLACYVPEVPSLWCEDVQMAAGKPAKPMAKSAVYAALAESTGLSRKQVGEVFDALYALLGQQLSKKGPGMFAVPGLLKIKRVSKPASKGGIRPNPFKPGEMITVKAKPARSVVKALPLKALKEMVK